MTYKLPEELGLLVLNYLATRPYTEVHQLIAGLQALKKLEEPGADEPKPD